MWYHDYAVHLSLAVFAVLVWWSVGCPLPRRRRETPPPAEWPSLPSTSQCSLL